MTGDLQLGFGTFFLGYWRRRRYGTGPRQLRNSVAGRMLKARPRISGRYGRTSPGAYVKNFSAGFLARNLSDVKRTSTTTGPPPMKRLVLSIGGACLLSVHHLVAASGIWTANASGNWSDTTKWAGGTVANGIDSTADFSTVNITANQTVTLDTARTIGNLIFADAAVASNNWTLAGANTLTLAVSSGTPLINVVNQTVTISSVVGGTAGFQKTGSGSLVLSATNTVSGAVTFSGGVTTLNTNTGKLNSATSVNIESGAKLVLDNSGATTTSGDLFDRLSSSAPLNMKGGEYSFLAANVSPGASFQTVTLALNLGQSIISLTPTTNESAEMFTNGVVTRTGRATALFRGNNLGTQAGPNISNIKSQLNSQVPGLSNSGSGTSIGIVPYLIGDTTSTGNGTDFVTYIQSMVNGASSTDGYKPLSASNYATAFGSLTNVKLASFRRHRSGYVGAGSCSDELRSRHDRYDHLEPDRQQRRDFSTGSVANTISGGSLTFGPNGVTSYEGIFTRWRVSL